MCGRLADLRVLWRWRWGRSTECCPPHSHPDRAGRAWQPDGSSAAWFVKCNDNGCGCTLLWLLYQLCITRLDAARFCGRHLSKRVMARVVSYGGPQCTRTEANKVGEGSVDVRFATAGSSAAAITSRGCGCCGCHTESTGS